MGGEDSGDRETVWVGESGGDSGDRETVWVGESGGDSGVVEILGWERCVGWWRH